MTEDKYTITTQVGKFEVDLDWFNPFIIKIVEAGVTNKHKLRDLVHNNRKMLK
jgi:hypothetical protein